MARKRAKGGGRKRGLDTARAQLTIRLQETERAQLEAAAKKSGQTVTAELLSRLRRSFDREHEKKRDPATRHLSNLVAAIARRVQLEGGRWSPNGPRSTPPKEWHLDPFEFRVFRLAVDKILGALEPPGEIPPPTMLSPGFPEPFEDPETVAKFLVNRFLHDFSDARPMTKEEKTAWVGNMVRFVGNRMRPDVPDHLEPDWIDEGE